MRKNVAKGFEAPPALTFGLMESLMDVTSTCGFMVRVAFPRSIFSSANLVPEALASVDAQEATPTAEEVSAVQEAPVVEEVVSVEETAAPQKSAT